MSIFLALALLCSSGRQLNTSNPTEEVPDFLRLTLQSNLTRKSWLLAVQGSVQRETGTRECGFELVGRWLELETRSSFPSLAQFLASKAAMNAKK